MAGISGGRDRIGRGAYGDGAVGEVDGGVSFEGFVGGEGGRFGVDDDGAG